MSETGESRWRVEQQVEWRGVNPYTIKKLVGSAGNIHITETGRYHVYWHREKMLGMRF